MAHDPVEFLERGGGFAGAELAGGLNDFARGMLAYYPTILPEEVRVVLVHSRERILPELSEPLAAYALERMAARGVISRAAKSATVWRRRSRSSPRRKSKSRMRATHRCPQCSNVAQNGAGYQRRLGPNPTDGAITVSNLPPGMVQVMVLDAVGRMVLSTQRTARTGGTIELGEAGTFVPGVYTLVIIGEQQRDERRFLVH